MFGKLMNQIPWRPPRYAVEKLNISLRVSFYTVMLKFDITVVDSFFESFS